MSAKSGKILNSQSRQIILAVDKYFDEERSRYSNALKIMTQLDYGPSDLGIHLPKHLFDEVMGLLKITRKVTERVVAATGISKNTVTRIRDEGRLALETSSKITTPKKGKRGPTIKVKHNIDDINNSAIEGITENDNTSNENEIYHDEESFDDDSPEANMSGVEWD